MMYVTRSWTPIASELRHEFCRNVSAIPREHNQLYVAGYSVSAPLGWRLRSELVTRTRII
jgi:hypothetical protein